MKTTLVLSLVLILEPAIAAQISQTTAAVNALQKASPAVDWNVGSAKTADIDCDGKADTVMLGSQKDQVVVGVVWASSQRRPQILSFPIGVQSQDSFTSHPNTIDTQPLDRMTNDRRPLSGCRTVPGCMAVTVPDDGSDPFNFYWDASEGKLTWWRM